MFIKKLFSLSKYTSIRRLYQTTSVEKKEKVKNLLLEAKNFYEESVPYIIGGTTWICLFTVPDGHNDCTLLEHTVYAFATACFLGVTFPISFPVIAFNAWRKRNPSWFN